MRRPRMSPSRSGRWSAKSDMPILVASLKRALPGVPKVATVDEKMFNATMAEMVETGLFKEKMPFARSVDNSLSNSR